jgi:hypothetical protein
MRNKRTIPELRDRLREIANEHNIPEIHEIVNEMYRHSAVRRAPNRSQTVTPSLAVKIRRYARDNPEMHQRDIAEHFNVNPGRISEAINRIK